MTSPTHANAPLSPEGRRRLGYVNSIWPRDDGLIGDHPDDGAPCRVRQERMLISDNQEPSHQPWLSLTSGRCGWASGCDVSPSDEGEAGCRSNADSHSAGPEPHDTSPRRRTICGR